MPKIIDCFLFFQELDLLEIRLKYLYAHVDFFVIIEADTTFSGKTKSYNFEENFNRYAKFQDKIIYFKISEKVRSLDDIRNYLTNFGENGEIIHQALEKHTHYDRNKIYWRLEAFQRECIRLPLSHIVNDEDIILISDLDEIPNYSVIESLIERQNSETSILHHYEFKYKVNLLYPKSWKGTIVSRWNLVKEWSLNELRQKAQSDQLQLDRCFDSIKGYHFTSVGSYEEIKAKIESWGHQEFNNTLVKKNLRDNIKSGSDIFARDSNFNLKIVNLNDEGIFDKNLARILGEYPHLIQDTEFTRKSKISFITTYVYNKLTKFLFNR